MGWGITRIRDGFHRRRSPYWFISFPKSGRTWTKSVVENYVSRRYGLPPFTFEEFKPWLRLGNERNIPRLEFIHPHCTESDPAVTHRFMDRIANKKVIVLVRDPREVVFTYYFRLRKRIRDPRIMSMSLADFIRHPDYGIDRVVAFTNTWFDAAGRFDDFLFLRLEDLQSSPEAEMTRLLDFLGISVSMDDLLEALEATVDRTTRTIEDKSATLSAVDVALLEKACLNLNPAIGYQVDSGQADHD